MGSRFLHWPPFLTNQLINVPNIFVVANFHCLFFYANHNDAFNCKPREIWIWLNCTYCAWLLKSWLAKCYWWEFPIWFVTLWPWCIACVHLKPNDFGCITWVHVMGIPKCTNNKSFCYVKPSIKHAYIRFNA